MKKRNTLLWCLSVLGIVLTGNMSFAQTFNGNTVNTAGNSAIPSTGTGGCTVAPQTTGGTFFQNTVAGIAGNVKLLTIQVNFTHTFDADVDMYLVAPNGQILELSTDNGGGNDNFTNTVFCDAATISITAGAPPYTGIFRPEGTLTASACGTTVTPTVTTIAGFAAGQNGTWQLQIKDDLGGDAGTMLGWSLTFGDPACSLAGVSLPTLTIAGTNPAVCGATNISLTAPALNCLSPISVFVDNTLLTTVLPGQTYIIPSLGSGQHTIRYQLSACDFTTQTLIVTDGVNPTLTCPGNTTINLGPGECCKSLSWPEPTASDNCPFIIGPFQLNTINTGGNANSVGGVVFFNINNTSGQPIIINAFGMNISAATNVNIYSKAGTHVGFETNAAAWTLIGTANANTGPFSGPFPGNGTITPAPVNAPGIIIQPGLWGIALHTPTAQQNYTNGNGTNQTFSDGNITLNLGSTANTLWGAPFTPRVWNGFVRYQIGGEPEVIQTAGPANGDEFCKDLSPYTVSYEVADAAGNTATCSFTVTVLEYPNPISTLICNDFVYVSLDATCTAVLNADQILEGGPYGCYDDYVVQLDRTPPYGNGPWVAGILNASDVGKTYAVRVFDDVDGDGVLDASENTCWGNLKVEDKLAPALDCKTYNLFCNESTVPCEGQGNNFANLSTVQFPAQFANHGGGAVFSWAGNTVAGGYYFNLTNTTAGPLGINTIGIRFGNPQFGAVNPPQTVQVFTAPTYVGNTQTPAAWTNLGPVTLTTIAPYFATGTGPLSQLELSSTVTIPAGQTRGFYIFGQTACPIFNWSGGGAIAPVTNGPFTMTAGPISSGFFQEAAGFGPCLGNINVTSGLKVSPPCLPNGLVLGVNAFQTGSNTYVATGGQGNPVLESCSDVTLTYTDTEVDQDCATGLTKKINRKWTAKDASGNTSTCIQVIDILRPAIGDVEFPPNYDGIDQDSIPCGGQYPTPDYLESIGKQGYPHVFGSPVGCSIGWTYTDAVVDVCDGTYKIFREWKVIDWCTGQAQTVNQVIKVLDEVGPSMSCPADLTVSTDPFTCCAIVNLPDIIISDNCSRINNIGGMIIGIDPTTLDTIGMFTFGGSLTSFPGNNLWNPDTLGAFGTTPCLPVGTHTVVYQAEDDCGNTSTCAFKLTVRDFVPPVATCTEYTVVSIGVDDPYDCYGPAGFLDVPPALGACEGAGVTWVKASAFDQGSYDNCSNLKFTVERMGPTYSDCIFGLNSIRGFEPCDSQFPTFPSEFERAISEQDSIKFYCCEVGTTQMIILHVYQLDAFGNYTFNPDGSRVENTCMIEVEVQDKLKPVCVGPGNVSVSCEAFDPSLWAYGKPSVYDNCCLDENYNYQGQCGLTHTVNYSQFDTVCNKGTIRRTFRVYDCHGNSSNVCTQFIYVDYKQDYWVKFPNDVVVTTCDGTQNYGEPVFNKDQDCELLGVSYEDQIFTVVPDACFKIERTWTIINWCTYNPDKPCVDVPNPANTNTGPVVSQPNAGQPTQWNPTSGYAKYWTGSPSEGIPAIQDNNCFKYKQIIKIIDGVDPTVDNCPASPVTYCDYSTNDPQLWNQSYWWDGVSHDLCEGDAPLTITATDACSGANINISYLLFLDLDGDGTMETVVNSNNPPAPGTVQYNNLGSQNYTGGTTRVFDGRPVPSQDIYRWANHQTVAGTSRTASVQWKTLNQLPTPGNQTGQPGIAPQLPYGTHKIKWTITDGCGNEAYCEYTFIVKDCKPPTVVCLNGLSVNIMPAGMITLWAVDFLQYGEDNCTPSNLLKYAIRKSGTGTGFPVDNNNNPITSVTFDCTELDSQSVELWAMDLAGNASYCQTFVDVQDPDHACGPTSGDLIDVAGALKTESNDGLEDANVNLQSGTISLFDMTDQDGAFQFLNAVPSGNNYTVTPTKDDNPLNGVSTYDLVLISKHILGLEPLSSPYKMIAADANKSNSITTFDIVEIRKLILGIYTELPNNTSWRFVDQDFAFPNPANPFQTQFPETKSVAGATIDQMADDFVAVKVGDVNGTAIPNALISSDDRTASTLLFDVEDRAVEAGETFTLTFKGAERVQGYQFTMNLGGLEVVNVTPGAGMSMENFGVFADAVTTSVDLREVGAPEFAVTFRALKAGRVSEMLGVSSRVTRAEAYSLANNRMDVAFRFNGQGGAVISGVGFELYQNQPNPFVNKTVIGFHLPEAAEATLTVFDESGRMLFTQKGQFAKGYNAIGVDRALLNTTGMMYYKLETATDAATKKMIQTK